MRRWRTFPLQLLILTILPLTLLLLVITFGSWSLHQQAMRTMVGERDERATRTAAAAMSEQLSHRRDAIRSLALLAAVADDPTHTLADATFLLPDFEGGLALLGDDGALLAATAGAVAAQQAGLALAALEAAAAAGASPDAPVFTPLMTATADHPALMLVAARSDVFVAVGGFAPANLAHLALAGIVGVDDHAVAQVITPAGQIVYQIGRGPQTAIDPPIYSDGVAVWYDFDMISAERQGNATYRVINGSEYVIAYSPIAPVGWALVVEEPWQAVAHPLLRLTELTTLIMVPVLVAALLALWFGARQIVQPLQALERRATRLGWGDFSAIEAPVGGIAEIQHLQTELIHMAHKVRQGQQNLRGYLAAVTVGQEEERRRLARDLHDDTLQSLIALNQHLQLAQLTAPDVPMLTRLTRMQQMAEQTITDLRRLTKDLRPIYLEDLGLAPALDMLARDTSQGLHIPVDWVLYGGARRLPPEVELALYRIAQEGLSNVARHSQATRAGLELHFGPDRVMLLIWDNGRGFVTPASPAEMVTAGHFGWLSMQERAELIGARIVMRSAPGAGASVTIEVATPA